MPTKAFHICDILSVTTGKCISPRGLEGVCDILSFIANDSIHHNQVPRVLRECGPYLLGWFPHLKGVDASGVTFEHSNEWIRQQVARFGEMHDVEQMPPELHERIDAESELLESVHPERIVSV
jgi:hypothetical protein